MCQYTISEKRVFITQHTTTSDWVRNRADQLVAIFSLEQRRLPCHYTYRRALTTGVAPTDVQQTIAHVLTNYPDAGIDLLVTCDGKTMRGTISAEAPQGVHLLAVYLPHEGGVLAQIVVASKDNDITAAPKVLAMVDLRGKVVIGDAMQTQKELSMQVVQAGGDDIWYVTENHPHLREDIAQVFRAESVVSGFSPVAKDVQTAHRVQKGHGRVEERTLTTGCVLNDDLDWPYLAQDFTLERRRTETRGGTTEENVVCGMTSLTRQGATAAFLLDAPQDYWGIENGLHDRRDQTLHEDDPCITVATCVEAIAILNNLVIAMTRRAGWRYLPEARRYYDAHLEAAVRLVVKQPT